MLKIREVSSLSFPFDVLDFVPISETCVHMMTDGGEKRLYLSNANQTDTGWNRIVTSYQIRANDAVALDRTHFKINA